MPATCRLSGAFPPVSESSALQGTASLPWASLSWRFGARPGQGPSLLSQVTLFVRPAMLSASLQSYYPNGSEEHPPLPESCIPILEEKAFPDSCARFHLVLSLHHDFPGCWREGRDSGKPDT